MMLKDFDERWCLDAVPRYFIYLEKQKAGINNANIDCVRV